MLEGGPSAAEAARSRLIAVAASPSSGQDGTGRPWREPAPLCGDAPLCSDAIDALLEAARRESLSPRVCRRLLSLPESCLPPAARRRVDAEARAALGFSLLQQAALGEVLDRLGAAGIEALAFKGPVLAALLTGDPSLRESTDLDLLVRPRDLEAAGRAVESLGYERAVPVHARARALHLRLGCEAPFVREDGIVLDLHWRLAPPFHSFVIAPEGAIPPDGALDPEGLWRRSRTVPLGGRAVRTLADEHHFLYLAFHGGKSLWARLGWVADVAAFVEGGPHLDWEEVRGLAAATGTRRALAVALRLARDLLGARLPPGAAAAAEGDRESRALALHFRRALERGEPAAADPREAVDLHLRMREGRRDRFRYLIGLALTPTPPEWDSRARVVLLRPLAGGLRAARSALLHGRRAVGGGA